MAFIQNPHPAMINLKVVYFTEMHGVRNVPSWSSFYGKGNFGTSLGDDGVAAPERIFGMYFVVIPVTPSNHSILQININFSDKLMTFHSILSQ